MRIFCIDIYVIFLEFMGLMRFIEFFGIHRIFLGFIGQVYNIFPSDLPLANYITTFLTCYS